MTGRQFLFTLFYGVVCVGMAHSARGGVTISTADAGGADAEVRESNPTQNRGDNSELASRVAPTDAGNRNSHAYMKWGIQDVTLEMLSGDITIRNFVRHENLGGNRISDTNGVDPDEGNTGFDFYVLDPTNAGANWDEAAITYMTAPGITFDANFNTKDIQTGAGNFTLLGTHIFRDLNDENHLPVGEALDLTLAPGSPLHSAIATALGTDHKTVTVLATTHHGADTTVADWINFNYILNPKEQDPLRGDTNYDMNVSAMDGAEGSPWGGAANNMGQFSPQLILIPEPGSIVLVACGLLAAAMSRRRT